MNPKPLYAGILACIITILASCHTSQSTTYTKEPKAKPQTIQLPSASQNLQVEIVTEEKKGNN